MVGSPSLRLSKMIKHNLEEIVKIVLDIYRERYNNMRRHVEIKETFAILLISLVSASLIARATKGIETPPEALVSLATVQASFLAIVVSVFLLSLQIRAREFSLFTLDEFGRSPVLIGLIMIYIFSILLDILYLVTLSNPLMSIGGPFNLSLGIPVFVAIFCLLALIPAQKTLSELVSPEYVLERAAEKASLNAIQEPENDNDEISLGKRNPPVRSPLLIIEQVLIIASKKDDEFSIQQSIYYMYLAISDIFNSISPEEGDNSISDTQYKRIYEHWSTCIRIGKNGELSRLRSTKSYHVGLIYAIIKSNGAVPANDSLEHLESLSLKHFEMEHIDPELMQDYTELRSEAIEQGNLDLVESINSSILSVCKELADPQPGYEGYSDYFTTEHQEVFASGLSSIIKCIESLSESNKVENRTFRRIVDNSLSEMENLIGGVIGRFDRENDPAKQRALHNIFSTIRSEILKVTSDVYETDSLVAEKIMALAIELEIHQDNDPDVLYRLIEEEVTDPTLRENLLNTIDPTSTPIILRDRDAEDVDPFEPFMRQLRSSD